MVEPRVVIVTTTIKYPKNTKSLCDSILYFKEFSPDSDLTYLVVLDDVDNSSICEDLIGDFESFGLSDVLNIYLPHQQVDDFGSIVDKKSFERLVPSLSIQRRNAGFLWAMKNNMDFIISIDDDNYPSYPTWLFDMVYGFPRFERDYFFGNGGWYDFLYHYTDGKFNIRGFPEHLINKHVDLQRMTRLFDRNMLPVVHQGFSLGDPDRSAMHRYVYPNRILDKVKVRERSVLVSGYCPFNTQNTIFSKEVFPAMFLFPMKKQIWGDRVIDRYDDIFMSYMINKIVNHKQDYISFGEPYTTQHRNEHDFLYDLETEHVGSLIASVLVNYLRMSTLTLNSYFDCYREIAWNLSILARIKDDWIHKYIYDMSEDMMLWIKLVERLIHGRMEE